MTTEHQIFDGVMLSDGAIPISREIKRPGLRARRSAVCSSLEQAVHYTNNL